MAGTCGSAVSFSIHCNKFTICSTKPLLSVSASISISSRSRLTRRKNHLRIKILKTLTKPPPFTVSPIPPQIDSETPIVLPEISGSAGVETEVLSPVECCPSSTTTDGESRLSESSDTASLLNFDVANFSLGSFVRFGVYLLALFAFQTICTVWVLDYGNSIKEDKNSDKDLSIRSKSGKEVLLNGNERIVLGNFGSKTNELVYLDESKMRDKIEEIRLLARKARKEEKYQKPDDVGEGDTEGSNVISRARIGIDKEIDARLVRLQKRLNSNKERIPDSPVNFLFKSENVEEAAKRNDFNDEEERNKSLIYKKKLQFRNSNGDRMKKPMGFQGFVSNGKKSGSNGKAINKGVKDAEKRVANEIKYNDPKMSKDDSTNLGSDKSVLVQKNDGTNLDFDMKVSSSKKKSSNGAVQETSSVEISKSPDLKDVMEKRSPSRADLWWMNLPYVLVIFMHRGSEDEEHGGLFTLRIPSKTRDIEEYTTYTVAFEHHVDANNFCYLLESFFEELDTFTTDVIPLPTKELEVIKSHTSKIIVVKKGQLQLYAGQPFSDVEMALYALVERNENVISLHSR
ncbi:uncharacterized protein LOC111499077 [Cucurbita maxima]|uniref:Uncharacterized protein LOC111499077 n=1 Tax=Cucurbita maxima TaxID=3661 RepID=A0A6J1KXF0_CUCMA|nr:uncharacterized protein LOC111499077 [Cucurbita maxima]